MINKIQEQNYYQTLYPLVIRQNDNSRVQEFTEASFRVVNTDTVRKITFNGTQEELAEQTFTELEKNTILYKDAPGKQKKFLIEKVKLLIKEKEKIIFKEDKTKDSFKSKFETYLSQNNIPAGSKAPENTVAPETEENKKSSNVFSLEEIGRKVKDNLGTISLQKLFDKQKEIINALSNASKEVFNFVKTMANHISTLSSEEKIQNLSSLKGLIFDSMA